MNLVFLDIDGVIRTHPYTCPTFTNTHGRKVLNYNTRAVSALNWLLRQTDARLVVSSTWREVGHVRIRQCLADWGVTWPITSLLPRDDRNRGTDPKDWETRGDQMATWLRVFQERHMGTVLHSVVLDDDPPEYVLPRMAAILGRPYFPLIRTTHEQGLTWELAEQARDWLTAYRWPGEAS